MWRIVLQQFFEHKAGVVSLGVVSLLLFVAVFSSFFSFLLGQDPNESSIQNRYLPPMEAPTRVSVDMEALVEGFLEEHEDEVDAVAALILASEILTSREAASAGGDSEEVLFIAMEKRNEEGVREKFAQKGLEAFGRVIFPEAETGKIHFLGTDEVGRDVLIRLVYGARISLTVGLLVAVISGLVGLLIGSVAGFYGGLVDGVLMRITDSIIALPILPVLVILAAIDFQRVPIIGIFFSGGSAESVVKMIVILCAFSWTQSARLVRGSVLTVKSREYVLAARTMGASDLRMILSHVAPNVTAPLLVAISLSIGRAILAESGLSFLGLGIQPPIASWGNMLTNAQELIYESPLLAIMPGSLIFLVVICFNFIGDALQGAIDPKSIQR